MIKILVLYLLLSAPTDCDVEGIYVIEDPNRDEMRVYSRDYGVIDYEYSLRQTKLPEGVYRLTRVKSNLYKVEHSDYFFETSGCYEYANYKNVLYSIDPRGDGTLTFM